MGKNNIELKRTVDINEVISYLEALVDSFKKGRIVVAQGGKSLEFNPPGVLTLEIEAKQKKEKGKFAFELSWKTPEPEQDPQDIRISSVPPTAAAEPDTATGD